MWRSYSVSELEEAIQILSKKSNNPISVSQKTIRRWLNRTEIYNKAQKAIDKGVQIIDTEYFDTLETYLLSNYKLDANK